jgi:uncharacterized protein
MTQSNRLIYLHGFRSSPASFKAVWLHDRLRELGKSAWFACPQLPPSPYEAVQLIRHRFDLQPDDTLVGSSLGGYYATYLAEHTGCRAVLLNPAVNPARDLRTLVGKHKMYHSDEAFEFRAEYLNELRDLEVAILTFLPRYFLIAAQGDELLDWREMRRHYGGAKELILEGSDHGLTDFAEYGDQVLEFSGLLPRRS